jgi:choline-sulfatase
MTGFAGHPFVETPNMDRIASRGTVFDAAYAACPLCVPSRLALLSGQRASDTVTFTNDSCLADHSTFLHALGSAGYETVLCGRMHFIGPDQRRGFSKRIMGEYAPDYTGRYGPWFEARPHHAPSHGNPAALNIMGGGNSPVLAYDRDVTQAAVDYLREKHEKPQCIVVGTYGPHFPYVAPTKWYEHYASIAQLPFGWDEGSPSLHPALTSRIQRERNLKGKTEPIDERIARGAVAAYSGMISAIDEQVGRVRKAWDDRLTASGRKGLFIYTSDHGDMNGQYGLYGKMSFYEGSARVPVIIEGDGVAAGRRVKTPVSLLDIAPTMLDATGPLPKEVSVPYYPGTSLLGVIADDPAESDHDKGQAATIDQSRHVVSGLIAHDREKGTDTPARMVRKGQWKLVSYAGFDDDDQLFDLIADPEEQHNLFNKHTDVAADLQRLLSEGWHPESLVRELERRRKHHSLISAWARSTAPEFPDLWTVPETAKLRPIIEV